MREYSVESCNRVGAYSAILVVSIILAYFINLLLTDTLSNIPNYSGIISFMIFVSPATVISLIVHYSSKCLLFLSGIPNLNGEFEGILQSNYTNFNEDLPVHIVIVQSLFKIDIKMDVNSSSSHNTMANIVKKGNDAVLSYAYENIGNCSKEGLNPHLGFCTLIFSGDVVEGTYYTGPERGTYGKLMLKRKGV